MHRISKATFLRQMSVGTKWTFYYTNPGHLICGPLAREVVKHENGRVIFRGPAKRGGEPQIIDGPGGVKSTETLREVFYRDVDGTLYARIEDDTRHVATWLTLKYERAG